MSLLGGQFLADIEHICLGSVSYDSDTSSSATSRSVGSIVSDASRASDSSRGCRPRVSNTIASRGHRFTFPAHLPHLVQEHLLPDSDHNLETQEHSAEVQPTLDKDMSKSNFKDNSQKVECGHDPYDSESVVADKHSLNYSSRFSSESEPTEGVGHGSTFTEAAGSQMRGTTEGIHSPNSTPTENGRFSDEDHERKGKETNIVCDSPCNEGMTNHPQENSNQNQDPKNEVSSAFQNKSSILERDSNEGTEVQRVVLQLADCDTQEEEAPQVLQSPKAQVEEIQEASNSGNDSGQGKEAQNAAALTHYLQKGCGAKILIALDQLGVTVSLCYGDFNYLLLLATPRFCFVILCFQYPYTRSYVHHNGSL